MRLEAACLLVLLDERARRFRQTCPILLEALDLPEESTRKKAATHLHQAIDRFCARKRNLKPKWAQSLLASLADDLEKRSAKEPSVANRYIDMAARILLALRRWEEIRALISRLRPDRAAVLVHAVSKPGESDRGASVGAGAQRDQVRRM